MLHAPLPLLIRRHLGKTHVAILLVIDLRKLYLRTERLALPRLCDNAVELVDLLEGETLSLVDHEPAMSLLILVLREVRVSVGLTQRRYR